MCSHVNTQFSNQSDILLRFLVLKAWDPLGGSQIFSNEIQSYKKKFIGEEGDVWNTWWEQPSFSLSAFSFIFLCQFCTSTIPLIVLVSSCLKKNQIGSNALQLKTYLTKGQEKESGKFWLFIRSGDGYQVFQQSLYITSDHALARPRFKGGQLFYHWTSKKKSSAKEMYYVFTFLQFFDCFWTILQQMDVLWGLNY